MAIIGYSYLDVKGSKNPKVSVAPKGVEVNHSISITEVVKAPLSMGNSNNEVLKVDFQFSVVYKGIGSISLTGNAIFNDTPEILEESFKSWETDKKLPQMVDLEVKKFVYNKSLIQAMNLSDMLNLPSPIPLPKFDVKKKE